MVGVNRIRFFFPYIIFILRIFLSIVFLISGITKLWDLNSFIDTIKSLSIIPNIFIPPIVLIIPIIEIFLGVLLLVGLYIKASTIGISTLLVTFMILIMPDALVGSETDCGCFGKFLSEKIDLILILRDIGLLGVTIMIYHQHKYKCSLDQLYLEKETKAAL